MKKVLILPGIAALALIASGCLFTNVLFTNIGGKDVWAGQLKNNTTADILDYGVEVDFLEDDDVVETRDATSCPRSFQAGATVYAEAQSTESASNTDEARARMVFDGKVEVGETAPSNITISNVQVDRDDDELTVTGTIKNEDNDTIENVVACAVVMNEDGDILRVRTDATIADLEEDDSDTFSITVTVLDDVNDVDTVDVIVDAEDEDGTPVEPEIDAGNDVEVCPNPTSTPTGATSTPVPPTATNTPAVPSATPTSTATPNPCD